MKIYSVLWSDRHSDTTSKPFLDLDEAIAYARKSAKSYSSRHPEYYKESFVPGKEFFVEYSCEGDRIRITASDIEHEVWEQALYKWEQDLYKKAMFMWGPDSQRLMLAEECAELAAAVHHYRRKKIDVDALCEEIADVEIMIGQMRIMYSSIVDAIKRNKLYQLEKRIEDSKNNLIKA